MKTTPILIGLAILATVLPVASATGGPIFCPPHNPGALTNACVVVNVGTTPVTHPFVNGFANTVICPISTLCFSVPAPTFGSTTTDVPTADGEGTYVEVTVLCPKFRLCRVDWPSFTTEITAATPALP